jgi:hypothetical protein
MNVMKVYSTTSAKIDSLPVSPGNLIFEKDKGNIYFDSPDGFRIEYSDIYVLSLETERTNLTSPIEKKFYYVEETNVLYRYKDSTWIKLTNSENINPIYFGDEDTLPTIGVPDTLYVVADKIYTWDSVAQEYRVTANNTSWNNI